MSDEDLDRLSELLDELWAKDAVRAAELSEQERIVMNARDGVYDDNPEYGAAELEQILTHDAAELLADVRAALAG